MTLRPALLVALLFLPMYPHAVASEATGPDADGAWLLRFDLARDAAGTHRLALDVAREDASGTLRGARDLGEASLPAGASACEVGFVPGEGAGHYTVALLVDGVPADSVSFDVEDAGATRVVTFHVPDSPTWLNLTNDDVNANGKTKSPGEAVVTRGLLSDANGIDEIDALAWRVERAGVAVETGLVPLPRGANATSHAFEHRYDRAPLENGTYRLALDARRGDVVVANASRTFVIREVAPTFVSGALPNVTPDEARTLATRVVLADKNGAAGPGPFEARVYRGSARVEGAGFAATLGAPERLPDAEGAGRTGLPLALVVPASASPGAYRVSLYHDGALLASLPFTVDALPTLRSVSASTAGGRLVLDVNATGAGHVVARLDDGDGASTRQAATLADGARLALDPPRRGSPLRWNVTLHAREGGPVLAERNGTWSAPLDGPALRLAPLQARARLPAEWRVDAGDWSLEGANATFRFTRWDGAAEPGLRASLADGRVRVEAPEGVAPGRYEGTMQLVFANGSASETRWRLDAGAWVELEMGEPVVDGRAARVPLRNVGGVAITRLLVEAEPHARTRLLVDNATLAPRETSGRALYAGLDLAPGSEATILVELPDGPLASGARAVALRVLSRVEVA